MEVVYLNEEKDVLESTVFTLSLITAKFAMKHP